MSEIIQITNYDEDTLNKILEQYKNSDNLKSIMEAGNRSAEDIEQALFEIRDEFWITTAIGAQLDVLGVIWNIPRNALSDSEYRQAIIQRIALNNSGEPEVIIAILKLLYGGTFVFYSPFYPAGYYLYTDAAITIDELEELSPSGVQAYLQRITLDANGKYLSDANGNAIMNVNSTAP